MHSIYLYSAGVPLSRPEDQGAADAAFLRHA